MYNCSPLRCTPGHTAAPWGSSGFRVWKNGGLRPAWPARHDYASVRTSGPLACFYSFCFFAEIFCFFHLFQKTLRSTLEPLSEEPPPHSASASVGGWSFITKLWFFT